MPIFVITLRNNCNHIPSAVNIFNSIFKITALLQTCHKCINICKLSERISLRRNNPVTCIVFKHLFYVMFLVKNIIELFWNFYKFPLVILNIDKNKCRIYAAYRLDYTKLLVKLSCVYIKYMLPYCHSKNKHCYVCTRTEYNRFCTVTVN